MRLSKMLYSKGPHVHAAFCGLLGILYTYITLLPHKKRELFHMHFTS
jgi:hypothetical protein